MWQPSSCVDFHVCAVPMNKSGGKSLLWMMPALREQNLNCTICTLVIIPLNALKSDVETRLGRCGLRYVSYSPELCKRRLDQLPEFPHVALARIEDIDGRFIQWLHGNHRFVRRLVLDECHLILTAQRYRPQMSRVGQIASLGMGLVLLSATLPATLERALISHLSLDYASCDIVRVPSTARLNIAYSILHVGDFNAALKLTKDLLAGQQVQSAPGFFVGLVYCLTKRDVELVAGWLSNGPGEEYVVLMYHSDCSNEEKATVMQAMHRQVSGSTKSLIVIGTTAFGTGIDIGAVRVVISLGGAPSLLEYVQHAGRGGRDGLPASAVWIDYPEARVIVESLLPAEDRQRWEPCQQSQNYVKSIDAAECRRKLIGQAVGDVVNVSCPEWATQENFVQFCDVCSSSTPVGKKLHCTGSYSVQYLSDAALLRRYPRWNAS